MKLIILSGRSGSGKTIALRLLEDMDFYCVDNLPLSLLPQLIHEHTDTSKKLAVSVDARNVSEQATKVGAILEQLKQLAGSCEIIYLDADNRTIQKRFAETRRRHPLSNESTSLTEAIELENELLYPIAQSADLYLETSQLSATALSQRLREHLSDNSQPPLHLLFQSFGYKNGLPTDCDFIFDARCLANPYWETDLRTLTGLDAAVQTFIKSQPASQKLQDSIINYLETWIPSFIATHRNYLNIAIGCTGGQHRSVFLTEQIATHFKQHYQHVQMRHRELRYL